MDQGTKGKWVANWKTGYRYTTNSIRSTNYPEATKKPGHLGSEIWGPYKKKYVKSVFGQMVFREPEKVDDVPILCRCRNIYEYMRSNNGILPVGAFGAVAIASKRPACWEDSETIWNAKGGNTFNVVVGHPDFYQYLANPNGAIGIITNFAKIFMGGKVRRKIRTTRKQQKTRTKIRTRKTRKNP